MCLVIMTGAIATGIATSYCYIVIKLCCCFAITVYVQCLDIAVNGSTNGTVSANCTLDKHQTSIVAKLTLRLEVSVYNVIVMQVLQC
jgi:hypothetical protein